MYHKDRRNHRRRRAKQPPALSHGESENHMAVRSIVHIDEELCNGCGLCVTPCAEGAIEIIDGKAKVMKEELCDGAGFCLAVCPEGALTVEKREAPEFDEEAAFQRAIVRWRHTTSRECTGRSSRKAARQCHAL